MTIIPEHTESTIRACKFALDAHEGQLHGIRPYKNHLGEVVSVLHRFGVTNDPRVVTAWLHDVVEDTPVTLDQVEDKFGQYVKELVDAVTDVEDDEVERYIKSMLPAVLTPNRATRKIATYRKTRRYGEAIVVKLADRIANTESAWAERGKFLGLYRSEHRVFREMVYDQWRTDPSVADDEHERVEAMQHYLDHLLAGWSATK